MDILKMLAELRQEREQLEESIVTLERLGAWTRQAARASARLDDGG
jgi:hypothetical protein